MNHLKLRVLFVTVVTYVGFVSGRLYFESQHVAHGGFEKMAVASTFDPRDYDKIQKSLRDRETDAFRNRLVKGNSKGFLLPGISSAHISWTWLSLLQAVHYESSYENDFSWMFSKIFFIVSHSPPKEVTFARGLAPFYLVIGKDHAGANIVLEEILKRDSAQYPIFFWGGFHGLYNLFSTQMAAWMYREGALRPNAPLYLARLSYRLMMGEDVVESDSLIEKALENEADPRIVELIRKTKPETMKK